MFIVNKLNVPSSKRVGPESLNDTETQEEQHLLSSFSTKKTGTLQEFFNMTQL